jgi:hypothetical protein
MRAAPERRTVAYLACLAPAAYLACLAPAVVCCVSARAGGRAAADHAGEVGQHGAIIIG